ncbi:MAG: nuclear transport factor 2 family protein [Balneola sp.]
MKNFDYKNILLLCVILIFINACSTPEREKENYKSDVQTVMNDWHNAAAEADFDRYFGYFSDSSAVFMGTDATERWTVTEFKAYSKPYFDRGRAWSFTPLNRHVTISKDGQTAWFDEELSTPNLGPSRGTGVLVLADNEWKIAHYSLTVPIPNPIMDDVKDQIEKELSKENSN